MRGFFLVVQLKSCAWFFVTPWTSTSHESLAFTISLSLLKFIPLSWGCHLTISSYVTPFSFCLQSFLASEPFPISLLFSGQIIRASASALVLPVNIQCWFPLGLTCLICLQYKGLSRVFSSTMIQKHQFFNIQTSLWSNSHICTWLLKNP